MNESTARRLVQLTAELYDQRAEEFSRSRARVHDGIERSLAGLARAHSLLDLGCGDARVARAWRAGGEDRVGAGDEVLYAGVDASRALLGLAEEHPRNRLYCLDLTLSEWSSKLDRPDEGFDAVVTYSFLHHLPGRAARRDFLREAAGLLAPGGTFVVSVWQFGHLERFRKRFVDPADVGVDPTELERGDTILDWQRGGRCFRYVHEYEEGELDEDLASAGLNVLRRYRSDGETGNLGLYSELQRSSVG